MKLKLVGENSLGPLIEGKGNVATNARGQQRKFAASQFPWLARAPTSRVVGSAPIHNPSHVNTCKYIAAGVWGITTSHSPTRTYTHPRTQTPAPGVYIHLYGWRLARKHNKAKFGISVDVNGRESMLQLTAPGVCFLVFALWSPAPARPRAHSLICMIPPYEA